MKSGQVKELVARWRSPEYDKPYRGPAFCADELEQAERVAVGQGGAELPSCEMCDAEITNNTVVCTNCWNRVAPLAAPRPEASTRELLELLEKHEYMYGGCLCRNFELPNYGKKELEEFRARGGDWLQDIRWHYWLEHLEAALAAQPEPNDAKHQCPNCGTEITVGSHSKLQGCWPGQPLLEKLRERIKALPKYLAEDGKVRSSSDWWLDRQAVLAEFEKEGK